jgi:hypothetical protein
MRGESGWLQNREIGKGRWLGLAIPLPVPVRAWVVVKVDVTRGWRSQQLERGGFGAGSGLTAGLSLLPDWLKGGGEGKEREGGCK